MVNFALHLGRNVAAARKRAGLSQEELSFRSSVHRTAISSIERGETIPRIDTLVKLAGSLGVGLDGLVRGLSWQPGEWQHGRLIGPGDDATL
jgi:transcriptional regulator with XRE-family HTH domain